MHACGFSCIHMCENVCWQQACLAEASESKTDEKMSDCVRMPSLVWSQSVCRPTALLETREHPILLWREREREQRR